MGRGQVRRPEHTHNRGTPGQHIMSNRHQFAIMRFATLMVTVDMSAVLGAWDMDVLHDLLVRRICTDIRSPSNIGMRATRKIRNTSVPMRGCRVPGYTAPRQPHPGAHHSCHGVANIEIQLDMWLTRHDCDALGWDSCSVVRGQPNTHTNRCRDSCSCDCR